MTSSTIVKYRTRKDYCPCCNQKLPSQKISEIREFEFSKEGALSYTNWEEVAQFEEDLEVITEEYVYDSISFFATNSDDKIIIEDSEINKVKRFILSQVVGRIQNG